MLGWTLGNLAGRDARLRRWCTVVAVLPDLDGLGFFLSPTAYDRWHHTFGHNVFLGLLLGGLSGWWWRSWAAFGLVALSYGSHLVTDAGLSGWPIYLFWPLSGSAWSLPHAVGLSHPINIQIIYAGYAVILFLACLTRRTPIELVSPRLDRLVVAAFRRSTGTCHECGAAGRVACEACGVLLCFRHARIRRRLRVGCPACAVAGRPSQLSPPTEGA